MLPSHFRQCPCELPSFVVVFPADVFVVFGKHTKNIRVFSFYIHGLASGVQLLSLIICELTLCHYVACGWCPVCWSHHLPPPPRWTLSHLVLNDSLGFYLISNTAGFSRGSTRLEGLSRLYPFRIRDLWGPGDLMWRVLCSELSQFRQHRLDNQDHTNIVLSIEISAFLAFRTM